ncbi:MAG: ABC transporter ATP-binding protein [Euryarchaeota archaeon]|nr:ABC transporter ATP-binding protein [Euryarchaeota archaeon]
MAVEALSLDVRAGEIFGFLGPNGAGKTTTIRCLLGFLRPTRGSLHVLGLDAWSQAAILHHRIGYVPGELALYDDLTVEQLLRFIARIRGRIDEAERARLEARLKIDPTRRVRTLSKGNKQKVGLLQAFVHEPPVLILDEPTAGLDPLMQEEVHEMLREARAQGRTVFLSSHGLREVEEVCDRIGMIRDGRLLTVESVDELKRKAPRLFEFEFEDEPRIEEFRHLAGVTDAAVQGRTLRVHIRGDADALVKAAAAHRVKRVDARDVDLEEVFFRHYGGGPP